MGARLSAHQRVVLAPQLAFLRRSGRVGRFSDVAYTRDWLQAAYDELQLPAAERVILMAHSAGFETALAWTQLGDVQTVLLMDALYARVSAFAAWLANDESHWLVSLTTGGSTGRQQRRLTRLARRRGFERRLLARRTRARHADVPFEEGPAVLEELRIRQLEVAP